MAFDARAAKLLAPGEHYTMADCPRLRFEVSSTTRAWIYRYKSPADGKMRQVKIGAWPAVSINAAKAEWEKLRDQRSRGEDPAAERRAKRVRENEEKASSCRAEEAAGALSRSRWSPFSTAFLAGRFASSAKSGAVG